MTLKRINEYKRIIDIALNCQVDYRVASEALAMSLEMARELEHLKTPHTCAECECFQEDEKLEISECGTASTGVYDVNRDKPWLCGHFKAKGTQ